MEQDGKRGPNLFVPALARKSIKRRNRVSIVRAHDTRRCVRVRRGVVCAVGECTNTQWLEHTRRRGILLDRSRRGKARLAQAAGAYLVVNINVFRTLVELIKC